MEPSSSKMDTVASPSLRVITTHERIVELINESHQLIQAILQALGKPSERESNADKLNDNLCSLGSITTGLLGLLPPSSSRMVTHDSPRLHIIITYEQIVELIEASHRLLRFIRQRCAAGSPAAECQSYADKLDDNLTSIGNLASGLLSLLHPNAEPLTGLPQTGSPNLVPQATSQQRVPANNAPAPMSHRKIVDIVNDMSRIKVNDRESQASNYQTHSQNPAARQMPEQAMGSQSASASSTEKISGLLNNRGSRASLPQTHSRNPAPRSTLQQAIGSQRASSETSSQHRSLLCNPRNARKSSRKSRASSLQNDLENPAPRKSQNASAGPSNEQVVLAREQPHPMDVYRMILLDDIHRAQAESGCNVSRVLYPGTTMQRRVTCSFVQRSLAEIAEQPIENPFTRRKLDGINAEVESGWRLMADEITNNLRMIAEEEIEKTLSLIAEAMGLNRYRQQNNSCRNATANANGEGRNQQWRNQDSETGGV